MMQSVMAALGDLYLFKLTRQQCNQEAAWWSLLCQLTSWFTFYCATRTLTNSTETVLTTMAMYYFPWPDKPRWAMCILKTSSRHRDIFIMYSMQYMKA